MDNFIQGLWEGYADDSASLEYYRKASATRGKLEVNRQLENWISASAKSLLFLDLAAGKGWDICRRDGEGGKHVCISTDS